jgi:hypothetical protein
VKNIPKQVIAGCLANVVWLPCLVAFFVSFRFESPLLTIGCFALLVVIPMVTWLGMSRILGREAIRPRPTDTQRYFSFIHKFTGPTAMVMSSVFGSALALLIVVPAYRSGHCSMGKAILGCFFMATFFALGLWLCRVVTFATLRIMQRFNLTGERQSVQPRGP